MPVISPIGGIGGMSLPFGVTGVTGVAPAAGLTASSGVEGASASFAAQMASKLDGVQELQSRADTLAVQAATGELTNAHDYTIAATQAALATELTVALRNKAVEAFTEIMRMQV